MIKIISKAEALRKQQQHTQHAKIVYFYTGAILPPLPTPSLSASSASITKDTIFACQQSHHRS